MIVAGVHRSDCIKAEKRQERLQSTEEGVMVQAHSPGSKPRSATANFCQCTTTHSLWRKMDGMVEVLRRDEFSGFSKKDELNGFSKSHISVLEYQLKRSATSNPCQCSSAQPPNFSRRHAAESSSALPSTNMPTLLHQGHDCDPSELHSHTHEPNFLMSR